MESRQKLLKYNSKGNFFQVIYNMCKNIRYCMQIYDTANQSLKSDFFYMHQCNKAGRTPFLNFIFSVFKLIKKIFYWKEAT